MSLVPLIYQSGSPSTVNYPKINIESFCDLADEARKILLARQRLRSSKLHITLDQLEQRIEKAEIQAYLTRNLNPLHVLKKRYKIDKQKEQKRLSGYFAEIHPHPPLEKDLITIGRCFELANELKESGYYVFTHGQCMQNAFFTDIFTRHWLEQTGHEFPFHAMWRAPEKALKWRNVREFFASEYAGQTDNYINHSIISVDGLLSRNHLSESALSFFSYNSNIQRYAKKSDFLDIFGVQNISSKERVSFEESIDFNNRLFFMHGRMNLIAIPKALIDNEDTCFVYRSHSFGHVCSCTKQNHESFLNHLRLNQQGVTTCSPQYRILAFPLDLHKDVMTFTFDNFSVTDKAKYEALLNEIIDKAKRLRQPKKRRQAGLSEIKDKKIRR